MFTVLDELPLITINVGNVHLALYLSQVMYLLVAAFVGFIAEFIVGWRLPFGIIGAVIAAFAALWYLLTYRIWHHRRPYYQRRVSA